MEEARLNTIIRELDAAVPSEGAVVRLIRGSNHPHECALIANRAGYLRLAVEMLRGAHAPVVPPKTGGSGSIDLDIDYLLSSDSDIRFDEFLREDVAAEPARTSGKRWLGCLLPFLPGLIALILGGLVLIGAVTVLRWLL